MGQPEDYIIEDEHKINKPIIMIQQVEDQKNYTAIKKRDDWWCSCWIRSLFWIDTVWIELHILLVLLDLELEFSYIILWLLLRGYNL
jgi:hypothetical protein